MPLLILWHKYGCHIANMSQTAIILKEHIDLTYLSIATKIQPMSIATPSIISDLFTILLQNMCQKQISTQIPYMCHICQCLHVQIWDSHVSIYTSYELSAINNVTNISHYWHMPLNKYICHITYVCPAALIIKSTFRPHITTHWGQKQQTVNFIYHTVTTCENNKHASQMPQVCHICHFSCAHKWHLCQYKYLIWIHCTQ